MPLILVGIWFDVRNYFVEAALKKKHGNVEGEKQARVKSGDLRTAQH